MKIVHLVPVIDNDAKVKKSFRRDISSLTLVGDEAADSFDQTLGKETENAMSGERSAHVNDELFNLFSDPRRPTMDGIIAVGGKLNAEILSHAYNRGIFPWPHEGYPLLWFCPDERGVIDFAELHLPKSFQKWMRQTLEQFEVAVNQNFKAVIKSCRAQKRNGQKGSWITPAIERAYYNLHQQGGALSVEVYQDGKLVGGIYGVQSEKYFSCESMFHLVSNASKLALFHLILHLQEKGFKWMDIQMVTSVCETFGGKLISKNDFLKRIGL
ncbi:MAG: leucyl/phenylalanyl-tRNA--protein transferase [Bdellovibrionaceae bacterium]|nr:leucyl/phenylalanyl-tRNA--protein transferase [Bdellovibrio sp.]